MKRDSFSAMRSDEQPTLKKLRASNPADTNDAPNNDEDGWATVERKAKLACKYSSCKLSRVSAIIEEFSFAGSSRCQRSEHLCGPPPVRRKDGGSWWRMVKSGEKEG